MAQDNRSNALPRSPRPSGTTGNKTQISLLEDYICSEMKPLANRMGKIFKDIFREELMEFIAITTNYKKLYLFEK